MSNKDISQLFVKSLQTQKLENSIAKNEKNTLVKGLIGSSLSFVISSIFAFLTIKYFLLFVEKIGVAPFVIYRLALGFILVII